MDEEVRHPRLVAAARLALYLGVAAVLAVLAVGLLGFLGVVLTVSGILAVFAGGTNLVAVLAVAALGLLVAAGGGAGVVYVARRVERRVVAADAVPDPVEEAKRRYVHAETDETGLERDLEGALDGEDRDRERAR